MDGEAISDTERAVWGDAPASALRAGLDGYTRTRLGSGIAEVVFRAGRIDVVWGVRLEDGREVAIKVHRPPVEVAEVAAAVAAQRTLAAAGYPCPEPLSGPDEVDGRVLVAEVLLADGVRPDGHDPAMRRLLAEGLARHIDLLRVRSDLLGQVGRGPSWCHYQDGPWPRPHDPVVDFSSTPDGYAWLDAFGRRAADQILTHRDADHVVLGHADWYGGNTAVADGVLVATFDWELVADAEAVIAGFAASCYAASATSSYHLSTPEDAALFLADYEEVRERPFDRAERRTAAGAVAWILAFNARWEVGMLGRGLTDSPTTALVRDREDDYLDLDW